MMKTIGIVLTVFILLTCTKCRVNAWSLFGSDDDSDNTQDSPVEENLQQSSVPAGISLKEKVKFEMKMADDKFLLEARIAQEMSPLDACHHRIVAEIEGTCADLSEEALSKLSVQLLNCQSSIEGRQTYLCSTDMTIGECTKDMDAITWNSYQIVSNRARSICYASRQNLFRMRTEQTIDRLLSASVDQLYTLQDLEAGQNRLRDTAEGTLERLEEGQERLRERQRAISAEQDTLQSTISSNLKDLKQESQLISSGNMKLTALTESISVKLDNTSQKLDEQTATLHTRHTSLAEQLTRLDDTAQEVVERLEGASAAVNGLREDTIDQLSQTLESMRELSNTVDYLSHTVDNLSDRISNALVWLSRAIGGTDDHLILLTTLLYHTLYFIVSLFVSVFLCLPATTRLLLLLSIPLNSLLTLRHSSAALDLTQLTLALVVVALTDLVARWVYMRRQVNITKYRTSPTTNGESNSGNERSLDIRRVIAMLEQLCHDRNSGDMNVSRGASIGYHTLSPGTISTSVCKAPGSLMGGGYLFSPPPIHRVINPPPVPNNPPPSPDYDLHSNPASPSIKEVIGVRRHLMSALRGSDELHSPARRPSRSSSPARTSTPLRSASRNNSLNRSVFRPPCLAETRTGRPCKLSSMDGSEYCHMHQTRNNSSLNHSVTSIGSM